MADLYSEVIKKINRADSVAVYCHTNPDGDTLGSGLALYSALKAKGKAVDIFCDTKVPRKYMCLEGAENISFPEKRTHDLSIAVDCSDLDRLGACIKSYLSSREQVAIDHHKSHQRFADISIVDENAAACAQLVFKLLKAMKALNNTTAQLLFSGIVTDSGCFSFSNTDKETHMIACELLDYKFDAAQTIYNVFRSISADRFMLKNRVLSKAKFYNDSRIAIIVFRKSDFEATNTSSSDTEGIISELIDIDTVEVAYAISEVGEMNYKLSIRTKDTVDAADCARVFGGGGHKNAAGCRVNGYLEDILEKLIKIASDRFV